jgi:carbamoyl-phosphate synthase large subunit
MSEQVRVLLLGAGGNAGINFVKALRLAFDDVYVVGLDRDRWNLVSSNADEQHLVTATTDDDKLRFVRDIAERAHVDFIHAQPDPEVRFLAAYREALAKWVFPHRLDLWERLADKLACQQIWSEKLALGFESAPLARLVDDPARFEALCAKTGKAWVRAVRGAGSRAALPVTTLAQAISWADYWVATRGMTYDDFMVAEFLPGREYAVQTFWTDGELVQSQARCRLVYFFGSLMPSGQSSTPAVAQIVDERDVYDAAYAAVRAIDPAPHGIYCVDLKRDANGRVVPMEVNYGRFFTTSDFFATVGVNTPAALVEYAKTGRRNVAIESVKDPYVWIRGLDKEPVLVLGERRVAAIASQGARRRSSTS